MSKLETLLVKADLKTTSSFPYVCSVLVKDSLLKPVIANDICASRICFDCVLSMYHFDKLEHIEGKHE